MTISSIIQILIVLIFITITPTVQFPTQLHKIQNKNCNFQTNIGPIKNALYSRPITRLFAKNWWDDDLPNILGINPLEAAIIFGILYYLYGPNVLYEYVREAGLAFGKYAPIIKDVTLDVYNEFRENLEENRELEMLKKQGIDTSNFPKRTTNIFERFQQAYESFNDMTGKSKESEEFQTAYRDSDSFDDENNAGTAALLSIAKNSTDADASENSDAVKSVARKSKKEVLLSKKVNLGEFNDRISEPKEDVELAESALMIKQKINELSEIKAAKSVMDPTKLNTFEISKAEEADINFNSNDEDIEMKLPPLIEASNENQNLQDQGEQDDPLLKDYSTPTRRNFDSDLPISKPSLSDPIINAPIGNFDQQLAMNKFQQQMSGQWNQRVLRKEKYSGDSTTVSENSIDKIDYDNYDYTLDENYSTSYDATNDFNSWKEKTRASNSLSEIDMLNEFDSVAIPFDVNKNSTESLSAKNRILIESFDKDYIELRNKLIKAIEEKNLST